jgi:hypothetical protein
VSRRNALIALAIASIALGAVLTAIDPANEADGNPSIIDFEFAWTASEANEIRAEWGSEGEDAARLSLWLDFPYLLVYGAFLVLAVAATRELAAARGLRWLAALGPAASVGAFSAPLSDALEDVMLLIVLGGDGGDRVTLLAGFFATVKFAAATSTLAYLIAGLIARLRTRPAAAGA